MVTLRSISLSLSGIVVFVGLVSPTTAQAASASVRIAKGPNPVVASAEAVELSIAAGAATTFEVLLANDRDEPVSVRAWTANWGLTENGWHAFSTPDRGAAAPANWMSVQPSALELAPGEHRTLSVTFAIPADAEGGQFAALLLEARHLGGAVIRVARHDPHDSRVALDVLGRQVIPPSSTTYLEMALPLQNSGNTLVRPEGLAALYAADGTFVGKFEVRCRHPLLPGEVSVAHATFLRDLPRGSYDVVVTLRVGRHSVVDRFRLDVPGGVPRLEASR